MSDNQLLNIVIIVFASFGLVIFMFMVYGSIADYIISHKPKGDKLKKIRNKTIKCKNNNEIKKIIRECSKSYKDGHSYFSEGVRYKYFDIVKNALVSWCENNNIEYDLTYFDNGHGMTIRIDFKEE